MPDRDALQGLRGATRGGSRRLFRAPAAPEAGSTATWNDTHHVTHMTFLISFFILLDIYLQLVLVEQLLMGAPHGERARLFLIYY